MENNKLTLEQFKSLANQPYTSKFRSLENIDYTDYLNQDSVLIENIEKLENKIIPDKWDFGQYNFFIYGRRDEVIKLYGFCLISYSWITPLSKWIGDRKCLEIMAGHGALSFALKSVKTSVIATDSFEWGRKYRTYDFNGILWTDVEKIDALCAIRKYGKDVDIIICSWPPYKEDIATRCLLEMRKVNPNCVMLYIGEEDGGCTADDSFFETMDIIKDETFDNCFAGNYTRWRTIHDYPMLIK